MASDLGFVQHVVDQLRGIGPITYRQMFGEYALYMGDKVVALVCDDQLFLKPTGEGRALLASPVEAPPYPGAKPYLLLDEQLDDSELLCALFRATEAVLPLPKPKRGRAGAERRKSG
jgi:TfoX/Sxy family transcriptional regulator of competence genes